MSDVLIRQLQRNIETLELLEREYEKRARPRARLLSIRSALNNAIIALKKTKARYAAKESQKDAMQRIRQKAFSVSKPVNDGGFFMNEDVLVVKLEDVESILQNRIKSHRTHTKNCMRI